MEECAEVQAGTAKVEITPSAESAVDLLGKPLSLRDPLFARVLVLKDENSSLAIVAVDSLFDARGVNPPPTPAWGFVMFPPLGHDLKHLRLAYDGYQEPYSKTPLNWDTKAMRLAPLTGAATSDPDSTLNHLRALRQDRKWKELIEQFASEDFSKWPANSSNKAREAFHLRGQIYSFLKDGPKAAADLKTSVKLAPNNAAFWLTLADNYANNLQDDEQALVAYRQAFAITGKVNGWQRLTATIAIARRRWPNPTGGCEGSRRAVVSENAALRAAGEAGDFSLHARWAFAGRDVR